MLFEMLTGQPPYLAAEAVTLAIKHIQAPIPRLPSDLARFQSLIDRLLAKEPAQRFADGHAVIAAIDELLKGPKVNAAPRPAPIMLTQSADVTIVGDALKSTQLLAPTPQTSTPAGVGYQPFFRTEEESSGNMLTRRYGMKAAFSCEDYEEFKKQFSTLQTELKAWLEKRGKKARSLHVDVQAHPWIQGRVREVIQKSRTENTPFGALLEQAAVTVHLYDEQEPTGQTLTLSGKDGKALDTTPH
jgi:serine/threonine-protein kinase PpkA